MKNKSGRKGGEKVQKREDDTVGQQIDGELSAQPKANLSGGFDPASGRLVPALSQSPVGGEEGTDPGVSRMSVVADVDAPLDEQQGVRDATGYETGEIPMTMANRGNTPLPEEARPTRDDTQGHRPMGTPEMGHDPRRLRK
jgi:hypothetical protein